MSVKKLGPLFIDGDPFYKTSIENSFKEKKLDKPIFVKNTTEAKFAVVHPDKSYSAIFIDMCFPGTISGIKLVHLVKEHHPMTPLFIISDDDSISKDDMKKLAIQGSIKRPKSFENLLKEAPFIEENNIKNQNNRSNVTQESYESEVESEEDDSFYKRVNIEDFLSSQESFFDVYVCLNSGKYLKVLNVGEVFAKERVQKYMEKNVKYFYLRKENHKKCLDYCDQLAQSLLEAPNVSNSIKLAHTLNDGSNLVNLIKKQGLNSTHMEYVSVFINNVLFICKEIKNSDDTSTIDSFFSRSDLYEHAISTTMIAALISLPLDLSSKKAFHSVGTASLLHDIGLFDLGLDSLQFNELFEVTYEKIEDFKAHPKRGADILSSIEDIPEVVVQAVYQHHERRDGTGFPNKLIGDRINVISEIVGISDDYLHALEKSKKDKSINPYILMQKKFKGFSYKVVEAFHKVFYPDKIEEMKKQVA